MKRFITKIAAVACTLTIFGSLTAFSTETVAPQNDIAGTHICIQNRAYDDRPHYHTPEGRRTWTGDWEYYDDGDWKLSGWNQLCRYRYRDTHYYCLVCGREYMLHRELQVQYSNWWGGNVTDWYYWGENDIDLL